MNCNEFQKSLPYIIETGGNAEEEAHLSTCPVCSDLVRDLRYIAEQAKLLVPMHDPSPKVWQGIQASLEREGLRRRPSPLARGAAPTWGVALRVGALAAMAVLALVILARRAEVSPPGTAASPVAQNAAAASEDSDDQQLLAQIASLQPELRSTYEANLGQVNDYIRQARATAERNPGDEDAQAHLMEAYDQKAVLYEMALSQR
ncbi:MAG TPA: hypothetical protein VFA60_14865 [Terriglobales bacterium]|jgi:hypothetical protein|nr:hypothetical protein [Terriglobales bacterium]